MHSATCHLGGARLGRALLLSCRRRVCQHSSPASPAGAPPPRVVFLLGKPGCGKGTQGELAASRVAGCRHLSAGALLRRELARLEGSEAGADIAARMLGGRIVPSEVTCRLLVEAMAQGAGMSGCRGFLIDGFPRNGDNLAGWLRTSGQVAVTAGALLLDVPDEVAAGRCLGRGASRPDDNAETLAKRMRSYELDTRPVIEQLEGQGLLHRVDGCGEAEAVFRRLRGVLERLLQ